MGELVYLDVAERYGEPDCRSHLAFSASESQYESIHAWEELVDSRASSLATHASLGPASVLKDLLPCLKKKVSVCIQGSCEKEMGSLLAGLDRRTIQEYSDVLVTATLQAVGGIASFRTRISRRTWRWVVVHNSNYFARPDNTGRALYHYEAHSDLDLYQHRIVLFGDLNMFTDRESSNKVSPTELDWIVGLAVRWRDIELAVCYEQDQPLDRSGIGSRSRPNEHSVMSHM